MHVIPKKVPILVWLACTLFGVLGAGSRITCMHANESRNLLVEKLEAIAKQYHLDRQLFSVFEKLTKAQMKQNFKEELALIEQDFKEALQKGANINADISGDLGRLKISFIMGHTCTGGFTLLHLACVLGQQRLVEFLISYRADCTILTSDTTAPKSPIDLARLYGHTNIVQLLSDKKIKMSKKA